MLREPSDRSEPVDGGSCWPPLPSQRGLGTLAAQRAWLLGHRGDVVPLVVPVIVAALAGLVTSRELLGQCRVPPLEGKPAPSKLLEGRRCLRPQQQLQGRQRL